MKMPVRCFTCGAVIAHLWDEFEKQMNTPGKDAKQILDELGIERYCCRRMFLTHIDLIQEILSHKK